MRECDLTEKETNTETQTITKPNTVFNNVEEPNVLRKRLVAAASASCS